MRALSIWVATHRELLIAIVAFGLWTFANYWYFKGDIARIRRERAPRRWSVDMAAKTSKGGRGGQH